MTAISVGHLSGSVAQATKRAVEQRQRLLDRRLRLADRPRQGEAGQNLAPRGPLVLLLAIAGRKGEAVEDLLGR